MVSHHQLLDPLFCEEDNSNLLQQHQQQESNTFSLNADSFLKAFKQDEQELRSLLHKEEGKEPHHTIEEFPPSLSNARREVVLWMLRVIGYYSFSALTAGLAVSYFDRFVLRFPPLNEKPWMFQLTAVACLSLAAKLDETYVPLLLDLQVEEPKYVFEPKNIQKMEILVLSTLQWKMCSVTPISFLDYIARRLSLKSHLCLEFLARCERLILSVLTESRFMAYLPSTMATAIMVHVITSIDPSLALEHHDQLLGILEINKEKVGECCMLIEEAARNVGIEPNNKRKMGSLPCYSPKGVFDLSLISDSSNDSWAVSSSPEQPQIKKIKIQNNFQFSDI